MHYTQTNEPIEGREEFIRANAVQLVEDKEAKIERLRRRVTELEHTVRCLRKQRGEWKLEAVRRAWDRAWKFIVWYFDDAKAASHLFDAVRQRHLEELGAE